jgi:hypothetical protein
MQISLSSLTPIPFLMIDSSDHITGKTGLSPTVTISKNGGAFAAPAGAVAAIGNGWYKLTPTAADTGTVGAFLLHAVATGADPCDMVHEVVNPPVNPIGSSY